MCGIAGVITTVPHDAAWLAAMRESIAHRGPDDAGAVSLVEAEMRDGVASEGMVEGTFLLHRRLSILDLSAAGRQPMVSPDGRHVIVFNGEIYNYLELRELLQKKGHSFSSDSDTEVLLAAYQEWGEGCLGRLVGMFAFAVVDRAERTLFLARDFIGIKPLFFTHGDGGFAFGSEIATLLELPWVSRAPGLERIHHYLTTVPGGSRDGTETFFEHVRSLPPAHWMRIHLDDPRPTPPVRFWEVDRKTTIDMPYQEAVQEVRRLFLKNVRLHLRSDVPVGAALSGGVDSSSIVMAMRELGGPDQVIHTFSYVPRDQTISEEPWIDLVGQAAGARVHKVQPDVLTFMEDLPRLIRRQGEPFGSTSIYAQYCVFRAAREAGIKVTLDGQGADEVLAGYRHYYPARLASLFWSGHPVRAVRTFRAMTQMPGVRPKALLVETMQRLLPRPLARRLARTPLVGHHLRPPWLDVAWFRARGYAPFLEAKTARHALRNDLILTATETGLPILLRYADRNSMAFSVESRVPFLTPELVSFLLALPESYHIGPDGTTKRVFRDAMRGLVPDEILDRKDKIGFQTTEADWLRELDTYVREVFESDAAKAIPFLRTDKLLEMWEEVHAGRSTATSAIWRCLNLVQWAIEFDVRFDGSSHAVPTAAAQPEKTDPAAAPAHGDHAAARAQPESVA